MSLRKFLQSCLILCFTTVTLSNTALAEEIKPSEIKIGSGSLAGLYYPTAGALCKMVNKGQSTTGMKCNVEATEGTIENLNLLKEDKIQFGLVQSDWQYFAFKGTDDFKGKGNPKLRAVFSIFGEPFTVVVKADSGINNLNDLLGKRINIGNPGSGPHATTLKVMRALGWKMSDFKAVLELPAGQQPQALCDNKIDAFVYTVGHPNNVIKEASLTCPVRLVEISGPDIEKLVQLNPFYTIMTIPGGTYKGNKLPIRTFGMQATLVTTTDVPDVMVYNLVKQVFENFKQFKQLHPVFSDLTPQVMLTGNSAPYADGAVKYYKEKNWIMDLAG